MNHIRLYDLFRRELHLSDDKAADFVMAVEDITGLAIDANKELLATKKDINSLDLAIRKDINSLDQSLRKEINSLDQSLRKEINCLGQSLRKEIQQSKDDTYKAIYLSGFVQFIAMLGTVLAIIKYMK
jgi:hypothetical protein